MLRMEGFCTGELLVTSMKLEDPFSSPKSELSGVGGCTAAVC